MFNPEKLLGGLLMGGSRRRSGLGSLVSSGAALGLAGVAMEAMEHFMDKSKTPASEAPPSGPPPIQTSSTPGTAAGTWCGNSAAWRVSFCTTASAIVYIH